MKKLQDVKKELSDTVEEINYLRKSKMTADITLRKRLAKKLPLLKQYILYLETNPTEDYCKKEVERITQRINLINKQYTPLDKERFTKKQLSDHKSAYDKLWDIPKLKKQLATVTYLLK